MRRIAVALMLLVMLGAPGIRADDLTDAILGVDPRLRRQSGQGSALGSLYDREDAQAFEPATPEDEDELPPGYGGYYEGLRSPLVGSDAETDPALGPLVPHNRLSPEDADSAFGYPDARPGVWHQDDLTDTP